MAADGGRQEAWGGRREEGRGAVVWAAGRSRLSGLRHRFNSYILRLPPWLRAWLQTQTVGPAGSPPPAVGLGFSGTPSPPTWPGASAGGTQHPRTPGPVFVLVLTFRGALMTGSGSSTHTHRAGESSRDAQRPLAP